MKPRPSIRCWRIHRNTVKRLTWVETYNFPFPLSYSSKVLSDIQVSTWMSAVCVDIKIPAPPKKKKPVQKNLRKKKK